MKLADKAPVSRAQGRAAVEHPPATGASTGFTDNRPQAAAQRRLVAAAEHNPRAVAHQAMSTHVHDSPRTAQRRQIAETMGKAVQLQKHGFELIESPGFKGDFLAWVKDGSPPRGHTITFYDAYLVLKKAEETDFDDEASIKVAKRYGYAEGGDESPKEVLLEKFKELNEFSDEPVDRMEESVRSIRHTKKKQPTKLRTALLGTYLPPKPGKAAVSNTLNAFVEGEPDKAKAEARKEKWLRVPDEDWSALVNARWVTAIAAHGHPFKVIAPLTSEHKTLVKDAFASKSSGNAFLKSVKDKYNNPKTRSTKNPLWKDSGEDAQSDEPSTLSYELAGLLDSGYECDKLYEARKGFIKLRKPHRGSAREKQLIALGEKSRLVISGFDKHCEVSVLRVVDARASDNLKIRQAVRGCVASRRDHAMQIWYGAEAIVLNPNFKVFLKKQRLVGAALHAWRKALLDLLGSEPPVKKSKAYYIKLYSDVRQSVEGYDTAEWGGLDKM